MSTEDTIEWLRSNEGKMWSVGTRDSAVRQQNGVFAEVKDDECSGWCLCNTTAILDYYTISIADSICGGNGYEWLKKGAKDPSLLTSSGPEGRRHP